VVPRRGRFSGGGLDWDFEEVYNVGVLITGAITFIISYLYCISTYGYLFGLGLGWIPSLLVGFIVGYLLASRCDAHRYPHRLSVGTTGASSEDDAL
jgi:hypothetical protein